MKSKEGEKQILGDQGSIVPEMEEARTAVPLETLREINLELLNRPEGFTEYSKLQRILQRRASALNDGEKVDWAHAETLAFATILCAIYSMSTRPRFAFFGRGAAVLRLWSSGAS
jgi:2-oxoglutarate dehydrogenase E1 component